MADGTSALKILGKVSMPVKVHDRKFTFEMTVADMNSMDGIWGTDFMSKFHLDIKFGSGTYVFAGREYPIHGEKHGVLPHSVCISKEVTLPAGAEVALSARLNSTYRTRQEVVFEPSVFFVQKYSVLPAKSVAIQSRKQRNTPVQLFNPTEEDIRLSKGTLVGYVFPADTNVECEEDVDIDTGSNFGLPDATPLGSLDCFALRTLEELELSVPAHLTDLYKKSSVSLDADQKRKLASLLVEYGPSFSTSSTDIGSTTLVGHEINTGNAQPFRLPLRRQGYKKEQIIKEAVKDGLERDIMEPSNSPWASAPVIVSKKDGTSRFCIDFRKLNSVTKVDSYPIQRFDDCVDSLHGSKFFCSLDLQSGYWQVPLNSKEDREKTAFLTKDGLFQFKVLPFGLSNAPATFERLMESVLRGLQ